MGFNSGWVVNRPDNSELFAIPLTQYWCRDSAFYVLARQLRQCFRNKAEMRPDDQARTLSDQAYNWWLHRFGDSYHYTFQFFEEHPQNIHDWMRDYTVPRAIERLKRKYPNVAFSQVEYSTEDGSWGNTSSGRTYTGIQGDGDLSAIGAFYWSGLIQRYAAQERSQGRNENKDWKDVNKLIERVNDPDHLRGWERLRRGEEPTGVEMMINMGGPLYTAQNISTVRSNRARAIEIGESNPRTLHAETSLWFDVGQEI
jgi:hypothetical protein